MRRFVCRRYGHIAQLAKRVLAGANSVEGVKAELFQVCSRAVLRC